jgi:hypothetical protein
MPGKLKFLLLAACLFSSVVLHAQWTRIATLRPKDFYSLEVFNNTMYAGATDTLHISTDKGNSWSAKKIPGSGNTIDAITIYNGRIYAGTSNGVFMSSDGGNNWVPSNINHAITSFAEWNGFLYASTGGAGIYRCTQISNTWGPFNQNFPTSVSGNAMRVVNIGHTLFAAAGMNGAGYRYDTAAAQWTELFYLGATAPGMAVYDLMQNSEGHLFALNNARKMLRSADSGTTWTADSNDMRSGIDGAMLKGSIRYYVAWNGAGGAWLQGRDIAEPAGNSWAVGEEYFAGNVIYAMREYDRRLFLARNDGIYYKANGSGAVGILGVAAKGDALIYPNPSFDGMITVRSEGAGRLEIRDMSGRLVHQADALPALYQMRLPAAGAYIVRLVSANGALSRKVIVQ